jgi:hypothetical protein
MSTNYNYGLPQEHPSQEQYAVATYPTTTSASYQMPSATAGRMPVVTTTGVCISQLQLQPRLRISRTTRADDFTYSTIPLGSPQPRMRIHLTARRPLSKPRSAANRRHILWSNILRAGYHERTPRSIILVPVVECKASRRRAMGNQRTITSLNLSTITPPHQRHTCHAATAIKWSRYRIALSAVTSGSAVGARTSVSHHSVLAERSSCASITWCTICGMSTVGAFRKRGVKL